jgi:hypothetical protein
MPDQAVDAAQRGGATTAACLVAMVGNGHVFDSGRQFAAWLGLTPGQYNSGGKTRPGRITKAGDGYLRMLLILPGRRKTTLAGVPASALPVAVRSKEGSGATRGPGGRLEVRRAPQCFRLKKHSEVLLHWQRAELSLRQELCGGRFSSVGSCCSTKYSGREDGCNP